MSNAGICGRFGSKRRVYAGAWSLWDWKDQYSNDEDMFTLMHEMRSRIMRAPAFQGDKVIGAILFENTMDRSVDGIPAADYLWEKRGVVPFLKVDKGLADEENDAQILKPMPELDTLLIRAKKANIFGTKMRSVIHGAKRSGVEAVVAQQFDIDRQILANGLIPIIEPEVNIHAEDKQAAEDLLLESLNIHLDKLDDGAQVMLKLTLPEKTITIRAWQSIRALWGLLHIRRLFARGSKFTACSEQEYDCKFSEL